MAKFRISRVYCRPSRKPITYFQLCQSFQIRFTFQASNRVFLPKKKQELYATSKPGYQGNNWIFTSFDQLIKIAKSDPIADRSGHQQRLVQKDGHADTIAKPLAPQQDTDVDISQLITISYLIRIATTLFAESASNNLNRIIKSIY